MTANLRGLVQNCLQRPRTPTATRARPGIEYLEDRLVPTITYHGGALLDHVEVQALYYGADWHAAAHRGEVSYLDGFLNDVVRGPYMDMLTNAGYGVGRGTAAHGKVERINLHHKHTLSDHQLRNALQDAITDHTLKAPDRNRLYVIFVQDDVLVRGADGETSAANFLGYHGAFHGKDRRGHRVDIRYAVIAYPGGGVNNGTLAGVSARDQLTVVTSHELAEAVTDPDINYKAKGWSDDTFRQAGSRRRGAEVGDVTANHFVYLHGYAVQRIANQNDQAMTPVGATAAAPAAFVLQGDGTLFEQTGAGTVPLSSGIASVSAPGLDNRGRVLADVVSVDGRAFECHAGGGMNYLGRNVRDAEAGQGLSYVLYKDGVLSEYVENAASPWHTLARDVVSIRAGTDAMGVNQVDALFANGRLLQHSDGGDWHPAA
jgi:hypothetical protein